MGIARRSGAWGQAPRPVHNVTSWAGVLALGSLLAACGGGGAEDGGNPDGGPNVPTGGDEIVFTPPTAGQSVGLLEVVIPDAAEFTLRGTLPLPPGIYGDASERYVLSLLDADGAAVPTQLEVVSRYPRTVDGADVVEIIARLPRPSGAVTGERRRFEVVVVDDGAEVPAPSSQTVNQLLLGTAAVQNSIQALVADPSSIGLRSVDVFGHSYFHFPLAADLATEVRKFGPLQTQVRTYGVMRPSQVVSGGSGTLDHLFGVHAYLSTLAEEEVLLLDLRLNNGPDGNNQSSVFDNPVGKLYFDSLELFVPDGYVVVSDLNDPGAGTPFSSNGYRVFPLVDDLPGDDLHLMPKQAQTHRRLAIAPAAFESRARALLDLEGQAFARAGTDPESEEDYYSWWNPVTSRYYATKFRLPSLEHVGLQNIRNGIQNDYLSLLAHFEAGTGTGNYPIMSPRLGWAHPWGASYGGMTGGNEIVLWDGVSELAAASLEGLRRFQLIHRMSTDRQANVIYSEDGSPSSLNDWLVSGVAQPYIPMKLFMTLLPGNDPFGFASAPTFQSNAVANQGRTPPYEAAILEYGPHLLSHLSRYTRLCKSLAYIRNDSLAKDDLQMQAELTLLTYNRNYNDAFGGYTSIGMRSDLDYIAAHPGNGFPCGRQEGWVIDTMANFYAVAPPAWRSAYYDWFEDLTEMFADGQVACSGLIYADISSKVLDGLFRGAQSFETAITANGLEGVRQSVLRGESPGHYALLTDVLRDFYDGFISPLAWHPTLDGPARMYAMGPLDHNAAAYCNAGQVPPGGMMDEIDPYQCYSTLGLAYQSTGDPTFLNRAQDLFNGDLFTEMMGDGTDNIENRVALLTVVQLENGVE
jgi:hypothetical protein